MRCFLLVLMAMAVCGSPVWAAEGKAEEGKADGKAADAKSAEGKGDGKTTESGLPKVEGAKVEGAKGEGTKGVAKSAKEERLEKILAGLEPKEAPAKPESRPAEPDPTAQILEMFGRLDQNGDQVVSRREYGALVERTNEQDREKVQQMFSLLDADKDGVINGLEVRQGARLLAPAMTFAKKWDEAKGGNGGNQVNPQIAQLTQGTIAQFDRNKDGKITKQEAGDNPQAAHAFAVGDTNQDKELSRDELYNYFLRQAQDAAEKPAGFNPGKLEAKKK